MADATTNLQDVAADRLSIFNPDTRRHDDVRDIFLNVSKITEVTSFAQQVGDEVDIILTYPNPQAEEVPSLAGIVAYIEQERNSEQAPLIISFTPSTEPTPLSYTTQRLYP